VVFLSSFYDPPKETQAAQALVSGGVDGLIAQLNDGNTCQVAEKANVPCIGNTLLNGASLAPNTFLVEAGFVWTPIMIDVTGQVLNGQAVNDDIFGGYKEGDVGVGPFGPAYNKLVSSSVQSQITAKEAALKDGSFTVYQGPIKDQSGTVRLPAGQSLTPHEIESINWAVQGVIGNVSK
jgi:basic membrane protein A